MIGDWEQLLNQFNSLRMTAFPTAYFEKDMMRKPDFILEMRMEFFHYV